MANERHYPGSVSRGTKVRRAVWNVVCALLFRPFPTPLFRRWRNALLRLFGARVHPSAMVYASASVWAPWLLEMEAGSCLGPGVVCYNQDVVHLCEGAIVSQYVFLCTAGHDTSMLNTADRSLITAGIRLERHAWVGAKAFVGMGVCIGEEAIVGATASVFKDVPPRAIVGGNPARILRMRDLS